MLRKTLFFSSLIGAGSRERVGGSIAMKARIRNRWVTTEHRDRLPVAS